MGNGGEKIGVGPEGQILQFGIIEYKPTSFREEDLPKILGEMYDLSAKIFNGFQGISVVFNGVTITIDARESHFRGGVIAEAIAQYRADKLRVSEK